jgi:glycosyltransferase involved in cell wall biosynthesis
VVGAIESAINQDYKGELEIVIIDDASTDDSINRIADKYECFIKDFSELGKDIVRYNIGYEKKKITFITSKTNIKQGAARNVAIREAWDWADYFAVLDSDDEMMLNKLSRCIEKAMEFPDQIGSIHTDYLIENVENGAVTYEAKPPYSKQLLMAGDCHLHSGGVISKKALEKVGLFDEECCPKEDFHMWLKISDFFMCVHIPEPLVKVRITPKNSTVSHSNEFHMAQFQKMIANYNSWRQRNGL